MIKTTLITPPQDGSGNPIYAVTPDELKQWSVVEHSDDDALITGLIASATNLFELYTGRFILSQDWDFSFDDLPDYELIVEGAHKALSVVQVSYVDQSGNTQTLDTEGDILAAYYIDTLSKELKIKPRSSWPSIRSEGYNNFTVRVRLGYGSDVDTDVPAGAKTALKLLVAHLYKNRESTAAIKIEEVPLGLKFHMDPFRVRVL